MFKYYDVICHVASLVEALAFLQNDIIRLRILEIFAMSMIAVYSLLHTDFNLLDCHFMWAILHVIINSSRLMNVAYHHFSVRITSEERRLLEPGGVFDIFPQAEFAILKKDFHVCICDNSFSLTFVLFSPFNVNSCMVDSQMRRAM